MLKGERRMKKRILGNSSVEASSVILGTHAMGGGQAWGYSDDVEAVKAIHCAAELGMNTVDLAPMYGYGHCEQLMAKAMKGRRSDYVVITKCGLWLKPEGSFHGEVDGKRVYRNLSPKAIREQLEKSLQNLGTDYVDIYLTHWQSDKTYDIPVSDTMGELCRLKKEGKIRAIGMSNATADEIKEYMRFGQVDAVQNRYSILYQNASQDIFPLCEKYNIAFLAYSSLEMGLLTGKIGMDYEIPEGYFRNRIRWFEQTRRRMLLAMLDGWKFLCEKYSCTLANLVTAFTISQQPYMFALCGARKSFQARENAIGGSIVLETTDIERMEMDIHNLLSEEKKLVPDSRYRF